eukprot:SAG31_NODE_3609_length_4070_cov_2.814153_3_plen_90_part_00
MSERTKFSTRGTRYAYSRISPYSEESVGYRTRAPVDLNLAKFSAMLQLSSTAVVELLYRNSLPVLTRLDAAESIESAASTNQHLVLNLV